MGKRPRSGVPAAVTNARAPAWSRKMAAYLLALTADGGIPLFRRTVGDLKSLPFASVGTLNAIHMFARLQNADLQRTVTPDSKVIWKVYESSVVLILVTGNDNSNDCHLEHLLDSIFAAMVMLVGLDSLCSIQNVERLKRELKLCFSLIDHQLHQLDQDFSTVGDLTGSVDCLLCTESQALQNYMDSFADAADSTYGCLLVRGKIAVATKKWWTLSSQELSLLSTFINSSAKASSRDIPVYLPTSCPNVKNRLLTFQLTQGVEVCVLCGQTPSLAELENEVLRIWKGAFELLKSVCSLHPRNFPSSMSIDSNVFGFILVNNESHKCLCSVHPCDEDSTRTKEGKCVSLRRRQEILRAFYRTVVGAYFPEGNTAASPFSHKVKEVYMCSDHHKTYSLEKGSYQLFVLFSSSIPTYAMRSVTHKMLEVLTSNKLCHL